jgi:hypothetical protein
MTERVFVILTILTLQSFRFVHSRVSEPISAGPKWFCHVRPMLKLFLMKDRISDLIWQQISSQVSNSLFVIICISDDSLCRFNALLSRDFHLRALTPVCDLRRESQPRSAEFGRESGFLW